MNEDSTAEASVRVNWTFDEVAQVAEHIKNDLKMDKVMFGLGGWTNRGYDNQHPDILPAAPDRHRGGGHPPTPATPPCVRVRTRRFESVTLRSHPDRGQARGARSRRPEADGRTGAVAGEPPDAGHRRGEGYSSDPVD
jgi:hypothetical protein